ncbi:hypothetical protein DFH06DRAFT_1206005 [Mycena polygramma]|nr:hypothetical protein DFH06DRAFT_1206005 [Mycena polygramma]
MEDLYFPNEILLDIFSHVDAKSLKAIVLASQRFHNLGLQDLLRNIVWTTAEKAQANIAFWERNDNTRRLFPTSLSMNFGRSRYAVNETHPAILHHVSWLKNLRTLSISHATLAITFYNVLINLPSLTHLNLVSCRVANAPHHFPYFSESPPLSAEPLEITVTDLTLCTVTGYRYVPADEYEDFDNAEANYLYRDMHWDTGPIFVLFTVFPHLSALTIDSHFDSMSSPSNLPQITTLSLPAMHLQNAIALLNRRLPGMPNVKHLQIVAPPHILPPSEPYGFRTAPLAFGLQLPLLQSFTGPAEIATGLIPHAPLLTSLKINVFLPKTTDALELIEATNGAKLRQLELRVPDWDDELALTIVHSLRACEDLKIVWRFGQPSAEFLSNLGVKHLPLLPQLHTLHLHAVSPLPSTHCRHEHRWCSTLHDGEPVKAEVPTEASCEHFLAVWTQCNPPLRNVRLVEGREWARHFVGGRWEVGSVAG